MFIKKEPKKTDNEVYNEEKLKRKSVDELKEIAKLRRIKNRGNLKKEGLITSILKSESSNAERNYMKHFNINVDNNNVDNNVKIRDKISEIRVIISRLGDIVTKDDRVKIKKELYKIKNRKTFQMKEKKRFMIILLN